jgi:hypothetical protein
MPSQILPSLAAGLPIMDRNTLGILGVIMERLHVPSTSVVRAVFPPAIKILLEPGLSTRFQLSQSPNKLLGVNGVQS